MRAAVVVALVLGVAPSAAFAPAAPPPRVSTSLHGYVPSGLSKEEYERLKKKERDEKKTKNFGVGGARGFQSRSMASFMLAQERGEAQHLFPVDPAKVRRGEIALKDVPYMQRGGSWDNSDLQRRKGWMKTGFGMTAFNDGKAKKNKANEFDRYNDAKPSVGIFGDAGAMDWTGRGARAGGGKAAGSGVADRARKNGISNDAQMWRDAGALTPEQIKRQRGGTPKIDVGAAAPKKKFFGLF